jgi:hypothetical protein
MGKGGGLRPQSWGRLDGLSRRQWCVQARRTKCMRTSCWSTSQVQSENVVSLCWPWLVLLLGSTARSHSHKVAPAAREGAEFIVQAHARTHTQTHTQNARIRTLRTRTAALEATAGSGFINRHKPTLAAAAHLVYLTLTTISGTPTLGEVSEKTDGGREKKMEGAESGGGGERDLELATLLFPPRNNQVAGTIWRHLQCREEGRVARWPCGYSRSKPPNTKP